MKNQIQNKNQILHKWLHLFAKTFNFAVCTLLLSSLASQQLQAQCPSPTATAPPINASIPGSGATTIGGVTYVTGSISLGNTSNAYTVTIPGGTTLVISAGSHLSVQNMNVNGTLIIQDGATVSIGTLVGGGSMSVSTAGVVQMCTSSALEVCGTTTLSATPSLTYVGSSTGKAVAKFSNYPSYGGSLTMPYGAGASNSANITIALGAGGGLFNYNGVAGSSPTCTIGSNCTGLPFTVNSTCGGFFSQTATGLCNAGTVAPTLSANTKSNTCPATTADITSLLTSTCPAGSTINWYTSATPTTANAIATPTAAVAGTYFPACYDATNNCFSPTPATGVTVTINTCTIPAAGTIDCAKTQIFTAPVFGQAGQKTLVVTVNVTTPGCFSPLTVSGSGMTLANGVTQVCTTTTGVQTFSIPVNYDGTTLGAMNFTVGSAGTCSADLTQTPKKAISEVWTLDCVPTAPPSLK